MQLLYYCWMLRETNLPLFSKLIFILAFILSIPARAQATRFEENNCVPDLSKSLSSLSSSMPADTEIRVETNLPNEFYRNDVKTEFGKDNHFQGIQRLRDPNYMLVSGGVLRAKTAELLLADLSKKTVAPQNSLAPNNQVIQRIDFDDHTHWHAGGLARLGDIVAVPLEEKGGGSRILFFDFSSPRDPQAIKVEVDREKKNAGALALEKLPTGRFLLAVYTPGSLDFYYSKTSNLEDGFGELPDLTLPASESGIALGGEGLSIVHQCDGKYFYLSFNNAGPLPPLFNGADTISTFEIVGIQGQSVDNISLLPRAEYHFHCIGICNFAASGSVFIGEDHKMRIYSTGFYRTHSGTSIPVAEFYEP